jgi:hypothetical protein
VTTRRRMPNFSDSDRSRLEAFLEVIGQIEEASIVAEGQSLSFRASARQGEEPVQEFDLFANEAFRSLGMSVRLAYLNGEPANFGGICNLLHQKGEPELQEAVQDVRAAYNRVFNGKMVQFHLHGDLEGTVVGPRELFEAWLYGGTFHQDDARTKAIHAELKKFGPRFTFGLQLVVMQIVHFILHIGSIVVTALQEEQRQQAKSAKPPEER